MLEKISDKLRKFLYKFSLYRKWDKWGDEEVSVSIGSLYIETNNFTIQLIFLVFLLLIIIFI